MRAGMVVDVAHGEDAFETLRFFIPEHDTEHLVVDELLDALRDAAEEFLAIEDGGEFAADLVEQGKRGGLLRVGHEQARRDGIGVADHWKWKAFRLVIHISQLFSRKLDRENSLCGIRRDEGQKSAQVRGHRQQEPG
jgi:hypothetical protein